MTLEYCTVAIMLICNLVIATEWAKYGVMEIGIQRPPNTRAIGAAFVGMIAFIIAGLIQKYGYIELHFLTKQNIWTLGTILLAPPVLWLLIFRYAVLPAGQFAYNKAITRTKFWTIKNYRPGQRLNSEAELLKNFPMAQNALSLFKRSIAAQEKGTSVSAQP